LTVLYNVNVLYFQLKYISMSQSKNTISKIRGRGKGKYNVIPIINVTVTVKLIINLLTNLNTFVSLTNNSD